MEFTTDNITLAIGIGIVAAAIIAAVIYHYTK